jgi:hypothetical protein
MSDLPKKRRGTFDMQLILRKAAENLPERKAGELGSFRDTSTVPDPALMEEIKEGRV